MKTVTFIMPFTIVEDERTTLTYPEGWVGEVEDDIAEAAAEEGCIEATAKPKSAKAAKAEADAAAAAAASADGAAPPV